MSVLTSPGEVGELLYGGTTGTSRNGWRRRRKRTESAFLLAFSFFLAATLLMIVTSSYPLDLKLVIGFPLGSVMLIVILFSFTAGRNARLTTPLRVYTRGIEVPIPFPQDLAGLTFKKAFAFSEMDSFERLGNTWTVRIGKKDYSILPPYSRDDDEWAEKVREHVAKRRDQPLRK